MSEKDGKLSADAENLRAVDDELAAAILEFRSEYKVLSTYVRPMIGRSYESP
jgi:DNA polymerase I-like protein with 3'-5' exonuclease and polymerase domains